MPESASLRLPQCQAPRGVPHFHDADGEWEHVGARVETIVLTGMGVVSLFGCWGAWELARWVWGLALS